MKGVPSPLQPQSPIDLAQGLKCPLLGLYGGQDQSIHPEDVGTAATLARTAGQEVQIKIFPEAGHGFHADYRATYVKSAAVQGWADMLDWFRAHGVA